MICPVDFDWTGEHAIRDYVFATLFAAVPYGARLHWISDSFHSGDLLRVAHRWRARSMPMQVEVADRVAKAKHKGRAAMSFVHAIEGSNVVLISACRSDQSAADAVFDGRPNGALTRTLIDCLVDHTDAPVVEVVQGVRKRLKDEGYGQEPQVAGERGIMEDGVGGTA